jgi:hypothetical protein
VTRTELLWLAVVTASSLQSTDATPPWRNARRAAPALARSACEGLRPPLRDALPVRLRNGAFPDSLHADASVYVPVGFDATRRPGLIVYFHGWHGCATAALSRDDTPCKPGGEPRPASALMAQVDDAQVNALLLAVELRIDTASGEPGNLAMPGSFHAMLRELLSDRLAEAIGCPIEVDALDRVVVIAHSGGYQAAASVLELGDVPQITEVVLLDALYGAQRVFADWIRDDPDRFGVPGERALRFIDFYTCCTGTADASESLARTAAEVLWRSGVTATPVDDTTDREPDPTMLSRPVVFKRVPALHAALPRTYVRAILQAAGFARISGR